MNSSIMDGRDLIKEVVLKGVDNDFVASLKQLNWARRVDCFVVGVQSLPLPEFGYRAFEELTETQWEGVDKIAFIPKLASVQSD